MTNNSDDQQAFPLPSDIPIPIELSTASNQAGATLPSDIPIPIELSTASNQAGATLPSDIPIPIEQIPKQPGPKSQVSDPNSSLPLSFESVILVENLDKRSIDTTGVRNVSFKLFKGKLACIMGGGENGASTLLRVLALEEDFTAGKLTIMNQDVSQLSKEERDNWRDKYIAYIRQSHLGLVDRPAHLLVAYWLHYYDNLSWKDAKELARQALNSVGIPHLRGEVPIQELSIAEVARVSIAKAHTSTPRNRCIYLFDDLFTGLDWQAATEVAQLLRAIARRGKAVVTLSNRQDIAGHFDHVLVMQSEEIVSEADHYNM